jgi:hypothetical protein
MKVRAVDTEDLDSDKARTKVVGVNFDVSASSWGKKRISFPYVVNILNGQGFAGFCEDGDKSEFAVAPALIGVAAAGADQGATEIVVDPGIIGLFEAGTIFPGMWLQFERGGNPEAPTEPDSQNPGDDENEVASYSVAESKVMLRQGLQTALSAGDLIYLVVKYGEEIELQQGEEVDVGGSAEGSAALPANTPFDVWYFNVNETDQKRVRLRLNMKYGPLANGV